jgi:hypothetical protein
LPGNGHKGQGYLSETGRFISELPPVGLLPIVHGEPIKVVIRLKYSLKMSRISDLFGSFLKIVLHHRA